MKVVQPVCDDSNCHDVEKNNVKINNLNGNEGETRSCSEENNEEVQKTPRNEIFQLLLFRGIIDLIVFAILFVDEFSGHSKNINYRKNFYSDICENYNSENPQFPFCENVYKTSVIVRMCVSILFVIGSWKVSSS